MNRFILAIPALFIAHAAQAHDWYAVNQTAMQCEAAPFPPAVFVQELRAGGDLTSVATLTTPDGALAVEITDTPTEGSTNYIDLYTALPDCQAALAGEKADGTAVNPDDLN